MAHRFLAAALAAACFAACGDDGSGAEPDADIGDAMAGGRLLLEDCGYELVTRDGASAPRLGDPVLGGDPAPRQVRLGLAGDPATSMVVLWRTGNEDSVAPTLATEVRYGTAGNLDQTATGATYHYVAGFGGNGEHVRIHETHLCGLQPDTEYTFEVGGGDGAAEAWSATHTFRTAPLPGSADAEVVFAVVGDTRDGYDTWTAVATQIATHAPDLVLFTGDAVTIGQLQFEWESFFDSAAELMATTPVISAHGNHEINAINFYSLFAMPGDEENFGLRYGPAHIVVLNDSPVDSGALAGRSADLLDEEMTASADAPWKFVMHHRSMWSASNHGSDETLRGHWGPIIDRHQVDMVLSGHDHNYERSKPMLGDAVAETPDRGTVYVVSGSAGAGLYDNGTGFWTEVSEKRHGFVILRVRAGMLEMTAYASDGTQIDSLTLLASE